MNKRFIMLPKRNIGLNKFFNQNRFIDRLETLETERL